MKTNMEREIFSQSELTDIIKNKYLIKDNNGYKINFGRKKFDFEEIKFIASGSSYNASRLGHKFFEAYTEKRVSFEYASEFISNTGRKIKKDTLYCFVSQSGETYDTRRALDIIKNEGGKTLGVVNNSNSAIYNACDYKIDMLAGKENSIAATKSFLAGVICLWLFAHLYSNLTVDYFTSLEECKLAIDDILSSRKDIDSIARIISKKEKLSLIGYNYGYILAKEGALKIKETSYIDTAAYPTGEFLHGHTAVLNKNKTLIEIVSNGSDFEENTLKKIKNDFNPEIICITDKETEEKNTIKFKPYKYDISKICAITVILQLLALKTAILTGADVDKPLGLNKVVKDTAR